MKLTFRLDPAPLVAALRLQAHRLAALAAARMPGARR